MKYVNSYFQLNIRENGVYLHIFPAKENGESLNVQEVMNYLDECGVEGYNVQALNAALAKTDQDQMLFLSEQTIDEVDEKAKVRVSDNRLMAFIRFYPPSEKGNYMTAKEIVNELSRYNVTYGISEKVIKAYLNGRQFCRDIPFAKGQAVVQGVSDKIVYKFETSPTAKPKLLEDGSVDFHQLNLFTSVNKDDLLAELIPGKEGTPGTDVYGKPILPAKIKRDILRYGKNIRISEDKTKIYSEVDGDVRLEKDTVFVSNTYMVPADVDTSTGDILYDGNVCVTGNVRSGFRVEASGDIEVNGVVEGATLIAGGSIVMKRGVQGMSKGYLEAGNDIVTKFLESCTAKAKHTINTGSSLHSEIEAGDSVIVSGKKGFLIGGTTSAGKRIEASVFGNKMNTATTLKVGVEPELMERFKELAGIIKEKQEEVEENRQVLENLKKKMADGQKLLPNQLMQVKQSGTTFKILSAELEKETAEYEFLKKQMEENKNGRVVVNYTIYPGVSIHIASKVYPVKDVRSRCQFKVEGADVVSKTV